MKAKAPATRPSSSTSRRRLRLLGTRSVMRAGRALALTLPLLLAGSVALALTLPLLLAGSVALGLMTAAADGDRAKWRPGTADVYLTTGTADNLSWNTSLSASTLTFHDPWAALIRALCGLPDRAVLHERLARERITLHCPDADVGWRETR